MISKSGSTAELLDLVPALREFRPAFIGILGNPSSPLAREMDVVLDASVQREADPEGFTPTASSAVALAIGHALAIALMQARGFTAEHFSRLHAGGQLGRNLRLRVGDAMHRGDEVAWVAPEDSLKHVVIAMSQRPLGAAVSCPLREHSTGLITDGDVRRALQAHDDIRTLRASDVMTARPSTLTPEALLHEALAFMEDRPSQISVVPVVDAEHRCLGLLRLHDIYRKGKVLVRTQRRGPLLFAPFFSRPPTCYHGVLQLPRRRRFDSRRPHGRDCHQAYASCSVPRIRAR